MSTIGKVLKAIARWSDGADWRSWITHAVIAVPICMIFGPVPTVVFYLLRELEQIGHEYMAWGYATDWLDHAMDVIAPAIVVSFWRL